MTFMTACFSRNRRVSIHHILDILLLRYTTPCIRHQHMQGLPALVLNVAGDDFVFSTAGLVFFVTA